VSRTTGPILAIGGINLVNQLWLGDQQVEWERVLRTGIGTGVAAVSFSLLERLWEKGAVALAWMALATMILARTDPNTPAPAESALAWWRSWGD
jgi:hypothetical protein